MLTALTSLDLNYNKFSGTLPRCLGELTLLGDLALGGNKFVGERGGSGRWRR